MLKKITKLFWTRKKLADLDAYVFIDASNIRASCLRSCGFRVDFMRLLEYLHRKYPRLKEVNYYEGIAKGDSKKKTLFEEMEINGYNVKSLERKSYISDRVFKKFRCKKCGTYNKVEILPKLIKMKSNVDVYLATEMVQTALSKRKHIHIILLSCDGDYAEAIRAIANNKNIRITVMATPFLRDYNKNTLSIRLKKLCTELAGQYKLFNIEDIKDVIS